MDDNMIYKLQETIGVLDEYIQYYKSGDHWLLEDLDKQGNITEIKKWIDNDITKKRFLKYHIFMTRSIFGPWKCEKSLRIKF